VFNLKRNYEPPRWYDDWLMRNDPREDAGTVVMLASLTFLSVRLMVTAWLRLAPPMLIAAPQ
jgi:hypothetical protein